IDTATTQSTLTAITHIGDLKLIGLASNWTPSGWCQKLFEAVYVTTGLPWWASLMVGTILLRVALLPLTLKGLRAGAILHNISPQTEPIKAEMMRASANKDMVEQTRTRQKLLKLHEDAGVSFFSPFWGVIQGPVALFAFLGIRKMVAAPVPGLETGGAFWFTDLTVADPTYILPLAAVVGLMATLELGAESGGRPMPSGMRNFLRALMVGGFFFTAQLPAAVFMYWIAANLISLLQVLAVNNPTIRAKYLHIPPIDKNVTPKRQTMSALAKLGVSDAKWMVNKAAEERRVREEYAQRAVERMKAKAAGLRRDW
ncbi:60Kd inner membrane protein-domain-containing protein, partial [Fimicolochytrium jonesii]|uniref:60Kd inner membrane protein-domain-containing protein n=1 Tax=Fimicolochytrium jonesii TaxID=1396493 RepID=UPI0022FEBA23